MATNSWIRNCCRDDARQSEWVHGIIFRPEFSRWEFLGVSYCTKSIYIYIYIVFPCACVERLENFRLDNIKMVTVTVHQPGQTTSHVRSWIIIIIKINTPRRQSKDKRTQNVQRGLVNYRAYVELVMSNQALDRRREANAGDQQRQG